MGPQSSSSHSQFFRPDADGDIVVEALNVMDYQDGTPVRLGDIVSISMPLGASMARVVWLGDTRERLEMGGRFVEWVEREGLLGPSQIVVEWVGENPLDHDDPRYAPVGEYMFTDLCCVVRMEV